ncbi:Ger(x)C family spore germination protein [Paenibacillus roseipurpureus]|uniref:Ger(X)C family spore germination protein n=1 Tax=Paenibacillus roseopurpureus TaxID=2918901 RepID=A0AA96LQE5_9BACL|nr:Ger(x)C family spore germination protein [Paenibacillus sp. MBLB1832]WNR43918.1 Ger(x)C family spore germination protein [Paenibacillus sp. MBLB1832]
MGLLRRRLSLPLTLLLTATLLTGCWDRTETNDVAFVLTSSADLEDDGRYRVAYMFPLPGSMGGASGGGGGTGGSKSYYIDSEVGMTFRDAVGKLQKRTARRIFLAHRRTIVIGEKLAKSGINSIFDALPRSPENRMTTFLVATKGKGYDLLNTEPRFERFPAEVIRELAKSRQSLPTSTKEIGLTLSFKSDPIMSYIEPAEGQAATNPSKEMQLTGYVQFKSDRMVGLYKKQEANGLMWLLNQVKQQQFTFPASDDKLITIAVHGGRSKITPKLHDDKITFNVDAEAQGIVVEDHSNEDLYRAEILRTIEDKFAEQVKNAIVASIKQMQKEGTDSAQLGLKVWRSYPKKWKEKFEGDWEHYFKEAEFHIVVKASIPNTGVINRNVTTEGM